jgi:hypothetical protein
MKIRSVWSGFSACGRMDGQTAMTKLLSAFRNFDNVPKTVIRPV